MNDLQNDGRSDRWYMAVDARKPGLQPQRYDFGALQLNCSEGCFALICCPSESDLPARMHNATGNSGVCISDKRISDGIHRYYMREKDHPVGGRGKPPCPVSDRAWAKIDKVAISVIGIYLDRLLKAIDVWKELPPRLRRNDTFCDGQRITKQAETLVNKLEQVFRISARRDRSRTRAMVALAELLREADAVRWPVNLSQYHADELAVYRYRAFPAAPVVERPTLIDEDPWSRYLDWPTTVLEHPTDDDPYELVQTLDGRRVPVNLAEATSWEWSDFDSSSESYFKEDLFLTKKGIWIICSHCQPTDWEGSLSDNWSEVSVDDAAYWFVQHPGRTGGRIPDEIRARLDSGVPFQAPPDKETTVSETNISQPLVKLNTSTPLTASRGGKTKRKPTSNRGTDDLRERIIIARHRRDEAGLPISDRVIAEEVGCSPSSVNKYLKESRSSGRDHFPRGHKGQDRTIEAYEA